MLSVKKENIHQLLQKENLRPGVFSVTRPGKSIKAFRCFFLVSFALLLLFPFFPPLMASAVIFAYCVATIGDYGLYRSFARQKYRQDIVNLNAILEKERLADFYLKSNKDPSTNRKTTIQATNRPFYPTVRVQQAFIKKQIEAQDITGINVLDAGCGSGTISTLYALRENSVTATELSFDDLKECPSHKNIQRTVSDVEQLPFKSEKFDLVNFTDIIEHVEDPTKVLHELNRVLENDGRLFLSTPNRHSPTMDSSQNPLNPLFIAERLLSLVFEGILPCRRLMQEFFEGNGETVYVYHTAFSMAELIKALGNAGFAVIYMGSYSFLNRGFSFLFSRLPQFMREPGVRIVVGIELLLSRLPIIRYLGANIFLIAQKNNR